MSEWLLYNEDVKYSLESNVKFLWREKKKVYIMDNHRCALWCWLQHNLNDDVSVLHVDAHSDMAAVTKKYTAEFVHSLTLKQYLEESWQPKNETSCVPVFLWDNFLTFFWEQQKNCICELSLPRRISVDIGINDEIRKAANFYDPWQLIGDLSKKIEDSNSKWIVDIDLDYFFYESCEKGFSLMFSEEYIEEFCRIIKKNLNDKIIVLTISLSPECCGGWEEAEKLCQTITGFLELDFNLSEDTKDISLT